VFAKSINLINKIKYVQEERIRDANSYMAELQKCYETMQSHMNDFLNKQKEARNSMLTVKPERQKIAEDISKQMFKQN